MIKKNIKKHYMGTEPSQDSDSDIFQGLGVPIHDITWTLTSVSDRNITINDLDLVSAPNVGEALDVLERRIEEIEKVIFEQHINHYDYDPSNQIYYLNNQIQWDTNRPYSITDFEEYYNSRTTRHRRRHY